MEAKNNSIIDVSKVAPSGRDPKDVEDNKDIAAFSYLWIMSVIVFFAKGKSPFVRYHSKQAMVLFALSLVFAFIPFLSRALELVVLVGMVFGFLNAAQGLWKDVPIIGPLSRREISLRDAWKQVADVLVNLFHRIKAMVKSDKNTTQPSSPPPSPKPPPPPLA